MKKTRRRPSILFSIIKSAKQTVSKVLLIAVAIMGTLHYMGSKADKNIATDVDKQSPLTEGQVRRLVIDLLRDRIIIQEKDKETKVYSGVRKAEFTELEDGEIEMNIPTKGLTLEPGMVMSVGEGLRVGGDIQWAYWKRWGVLAGATAPVQSRSLDKLRGHVALSYSPYWRWIPNSSVFGGIDTNKQPIFGVRTRF